MLKASVDGRLNYTQYRKKDPIFKIREHLVLEELRQNIYTDVWRTVSIAAKNSEAFEKYLDNIQPWSKAAARVRAQARKERIRKHQYEFPEYRKEVEGLMAQKVPREEAEDLAEFRMLKKLGKL